MKCLFHSAIFYTLLHSFCVISLNSIAKKIDYINPSQLALIRASALFAGTLPAAVYFTKEVLGPKKYRSLLLIRGFVGATSLYLNLAASWYLPLVEATTIISTVPVAVTIIARIYLKERIGLVECCSILFTIIGILLTVRLPEYLMRKQHTVPTSTYITGVAFAICCVFFLSMVFILQRKLKAVSLTVSILYTAVAGITENAILTPVLSSYALANCGWDSSMLVVIGILGLLSQWFLNAAIQMEKAGIASVLKQSFDIIFALLYQIVAFGHNPDFYSISGCLLVTISIGINGVKKWLLSLSEDAIFRKKLKFLLL